MHRQLAAGKLFQPLADLVAVHCAASALQKPQDYQCARAGVQFLLEFAIRSLSVHFSLILGPSIDDCYVLIS
jgi:hypothetical protein